MKRFEVEKAEQNENKHKFQYNGILILLSNAVGLAFFYGTLKNSEMEILLNFLRNQKIIKLILKIKFF